MKTQGLKQRILNELLEDNFLISRHCRRTVERISDVSLSYYFQNIASRRSQFALEIGEEIEYYSGRKPFLSSSGYDRNRTEPEPEPLLKVLKKSLKLNKSSLQKYQDALCRIHEGSCREILLRHKAYVENCICELRSLKRLLKHGLQQKESYEELRRQA